MNVNFRTSNLKLISNADKICHVTSHMVSNRQVDTISVGIGVSERENSGTIHPICLKVFMECEHKSNCNAVHFKGLKSYRINIL